VQLRGQDMRLHELLDKTENFRSRFWWQSCGRLCRVASSLKRVLWFSEVVCCWMLIYIVVYRGTCVNDIVGE